MERAVSVIGALAAIDQATLSVKVSGRLQSLIVDLGTRVKRGELVAQIESVDYELKLRSAEALLAQARARLGLLLVGADDDQEMAEAERLNDEIVRLALSMDGTCTGEHGIGLHKMGFLVEEVGDDAIDLMRRIKHAFDPDNILNPGKIFRM